MTLAFACEKRQWDWRGHERIGQSYLSGVHALLYFYRQTRERKSTIGREEANVQMGRTRVVGEVGELDTVTYVFLFGLNFTGDAVCRRMYSRVCQRDMLNLEGDRGMRLFHECYI